MSPFGRLRRTPVEVALPIALLPAHRDRWYAEPVEAALQATTPGSRVRDAGTMVDEDGFTESCDIVAEIPLGRRRDGAVELVGAALERIGVPQGTVVRAGASSVIVGTDAVVTVRLPLLRSQGHRGEDRIPHNDDTDALTEQLDDALGTLGEVRSAQVTALGTQLTLVGRELQPLREVASGVIRASPFGRGARVMSSDDAPAQGEWGVRLAPVSSLRVHWRGPAVYYVVREDGRAFAGATQDLRRRVESHDRLTRALGSQIVEVRQRTEGVSTPHERRTELHRLMRSFDEGY